MASFVTASCLDFGDDNAVDMGVKYEVYIDNGVSSSATRYKVTDIKVHPAYDAKTKANNIAILQYNANSNESWTNSVGIDPKDWDTPVYAQRVLKDSGENAVWGESKLYTYQSQNDSSCSTLLPLYKANKDDFICNDLLTSAPNKLSSCDIPYQVVYAQVGEAMYPVGIFSHAAVKGSDNFCNNEKVRSYYTVYADYVEFAEKTLSRTLDYYAGDKDKKPQTDPDYEMDKPSSDLVDRVAIVDGDFYAPGNGGGENDDSSGNEGGSTDEDDSGNDNSSIDKTDGSVENGEDNSSDRLSRTSIIILAVCLSVGVPILAVAAFFLFRRLQKRAQHLRDPYKETAVHELLADDIGGASLPGERWAGGNVHDNPPDYRPPPAYEARQQAQAGTADRTDNIEQAAARDEAREQQRPDTALLNEKR
ncbi:hypothetical protein COEREDRAFT_83199 [Coemansia reversa NRRL 1564]|uniref:Peptidase S1 domain-containing protein n=1 Tax=Coemansia reversa (strain ATCC 12441 / NRRL 1564) TaxID=763665 RepID=A0A2G5B4A1_COERN|nr:hypothetical protein COEREDRAFT_83199 [Coemansia reversa NRRL 1564]|eukprot:PIA13830.1 hypothetical protein COEREDRAFT_83199 [Coemansia reversa NRRL 1564]